VVDSVAALVPQQEIDGVMGASHVGLQARLMSQALRKLSGIIGKTNCVVIFINQLREKVGIMYGNPETTPGGRALKFYSSVRIDIRKTDNLKKGSDVYGSHVKACGRIAPVGLVCIVSTVNSAIGQKQTVEGSIDIIVSVNYRVVGRTSIESSLCVVVSGSLLVFCSCVRVDNLLSGSNHLLQLSLLSLGSNASALCTL
jgi:protein RecA